MYADKKIDSNTSDFLKIIWNYYKNFSGSELSYKTHLPGTPWNMTYTEHQFKVIENSTIKKYYKKLLDEKRRKATQH